MINIDITSPLVLPGDVILTPVSQLPDDFRRQMEAGDGDFAIARRRSRAPTRIIDSEAAALLQEFRTAKTIVQAVISHSRATNVDPEEALDAAFPMIRRFLDSRLLVPADSQAADQIVNSFAIGDQVGDFTILDCIQVREDTEIYQAKWASGQEAALKISRPGAAPELRRMLEREATILKHLDGSVSPRLLDQGVFEGRPYLAIEWCSGVHVTAVAEELRQLPRGEGRRQFLDLCCAILDAYGRLHAQNVIHSDVHQANMLIDADGSIKIIDFGLARWPGGSEDLARPHRAGVGFFFEPECAEAVRAGQQPPESSYLGEQHALAAMLYFLFTGAYHVDFSLERDEMLRQIAEDPMLPFSRRGVRPWPEIESVLAPALSKEPSDRYPSVSEFARTLREVAAQAEDGVLSEPGSAAHGGSSTRADMLLSEVLARVQTSGQLFQSGLTTPPTCSVNHGAAGIAYALYRIAGVRADPELLALADIWVNRAVRDVETYSAFFNDDLDITARTVGHISPYHTASGLHCVQALISHATGDIPAQQEAIEGFISKSNAPCENLDLTLGRSSSLLANSLLLDTARDNDRLLRFGNELLGGIWSEIDTFAPIGECAEVGYLGIAHGWAGILYATMRWSQASGIAVPASVEERLRQIAELAEHRGRGIRWPVDGRNDSHRADNYMSGWCHGSAGYVHLWTLAHQIFKDEPFLTLAERAAWNAWEDPNLTGSLCCGLAGRAYGLLNVYRYTGESDWLRRARQLANKAAMGFRDRDEPIDSLYKGEIGVAVLAADLSNPEYSSMPFFEAEGWLNRPEFGGDSPRNSQVGVGRPTEPDLPRRKEVP